jgi:hypothetical protein
MKTNKIYRGWIFAGLLILALTGCADIFRPGTGSGELAGGPAPQGMGTARISLNGSGARTVVPGSGDLYFTLGFTAPEKTEVNKTLSGDNLTLTVALEPAVWTLEVRGYADSGHTDLKVRGSAAVPITAGTTSSFDVYLIPDFGSGETGSLNYSVGFPASVRGWLGLYPIDDTKGTSREIDISTGAGGSASNTLTGLAEGSYRAVISLYDRGNNRAAAWTGAVHIVGGSTTSLAHVFTAVDFAECPPIAGEGAATLADKLNAALASSTGAYTLVLEGTETDLGSFTLKPLTVTGGREIRITVRGNGNTVTLGSTGSLFTLGAGSGSSLGLELHDLTLAGRTGNDASLVLVNSGGTLEMKAGSRITGNRNTYYSGGGVYVAGGTFTMSGGAVSGNSASSYGGGVCVAGGTFIMSGGAVSGNSSSYSSSSQAVSSGGGVYVAGGTFTMSGGAVSGNSSSASAYSSYSLVASSSGGGVYVGSGTFTMSGGTVSGNSSSAASSSSSSDSDSNGGGVYVGSGTFTMSGGTVSGNSASSSNSSPNSSYSYSSGGGVYVGSGTFTMSGGAVSGNSASSSSNSSSNSSGGGVYVDSGTFTKQPGAVIYGSNESDGTLKNTAGDDGHAVYVEGSSGTGLKIRNTTAGTGITLDSSLSGPAGGWEEPPPGEGISGITYSSVSGGEWTLQSDGRRKSPSISHGGVTKTRVSFTAMANANIRIALDVSSESGYDFAFISTLDNGSATSGSGYYTRISGTTSVTVSIPVPSAGSHFIEIGYQKDGSQSSGSDCAWFKVIE